MLSRSGNHRKNRVTIITTTTIATTTCTRSSKSSSTNTAITIAIDCVVHRLRKKRKRTTAASFPFLGKPGVPINEISCIVVFVFFISSKK